MQKEIIVGLASFVLVACGASSGDPAPSSSSPSPSTSPPAVAPDVPLTSAAPKKAITRVFGAKPTTAAGLPIEYHGGYVMDAGVNVYLVWYGDWTGWKAPTILPDFVQHLGGSPYYGINTTYDDAHGRRAGNAVTLAGQVTVGYTHGTSLGDGEVGQIAEEAIRAGQLPLDVHGVYFVLTSDDVAEGGFCAGYCGYHSYELVDDVYVKYAFVGNPAQCPYGCEPQQDASPNDSLSADGMASIFAHELSETVSDPYVDAWYDADGEENADKCAWTFGDEYTTSNGARANVRLGDRDYLIQQNWVQDPNGGGCALSP